MLAAPQEADSLSSGNLSEHQRAQHSDRVRRGAVEMSGNFARGVEAGHWPLRVQHFGLRVGGKAAKSVGDGASKRIGEKRRFFKPPRPVPPPRPPECPLPCPL